MLIQFLNKLNLLFRKVCAAVDVGGVAVGVVVAVGGDLKSKR